MDLRSLSANLTAKVELIHPVDGPTGVVVELASRDHPDVQAATRAIADKRLAVLAKRGGKIMAKAEELEAEGLDVLVASILGWSGLTSDGKDWPCSADNARQLLESAPWARRQLVAAQEDEALFFEK